MPKKAATATRNVKGQESVECFHNFNVDENTECRTGTVCRVIVHKNSTRGDPTFDQEASAPSGGRALALGFLPERERAPKSFRARVRQAPMSGGFGRLHSEEAAVEEAQAAADKTKRSSSFPVRIMRGLSFPKKYKIGGEVRDVVLDKRHRVLILARILLAVPAPAFLVFSAVQHFQPDTILMTSWGLSASFTRLQAGKMFAVYVLSLIHISEPTRPY